MNAAGLRILHHLEKMAPISSTNDSMCAWIACLASFTDTQAPWSSPEASEQATSLLRHRKGEGDPQMLQDLITDLLRDHVKPRFAKAQNPAITPQSRKAIDPRYENSVHVGNEEETKPWKYRDPYIITVFGWILDRLDVY